MESRGAKCDAVDDYLRWPHVTTFAQATGLGSRTPRALSRFCVFGVTSETQTKHFYDISQISPCDIAA